MNNSEEATKKEGDAKKDAAEAKKAAAAAEPTSQRSKRQSGPKKFANRLSKWKLMRNTDDSQRSKRQPQSLRSKRQPQQKSDSVDGGGGKEGGTVRQKKKNIDSLENKETAEPQTQQKTESEIQVEPAKDNRICSEIFGYGSEFLDEWLEEPHTLELKVDPPKKKKFPVVKVSKTLIIYEVPQELTSKMEIGDILSKFNDLSLPTREEYIKQLSFVMKNPDFQTLTFTILRPLKWKPLAEKELYDHFSKLEQPQGFEILPSHFDYLTVFLTIAPKTTLGLTIKGFNGKVYVSGIENKVTSIARRVLLVGDAIFCIDDTVVTGIKMTEDALALACSKKKFVKLLVERAKNANGVKIVKIALGTEKTVEINPRMGDDIIELCNAQLNLMELDEKEPPKGIYRAKPPPKEKKKKHAYVCNESVETPISTDVNNITLLASTPPVPCARPMSEYDGKGGYVQGTPTQVRQLQHQLQQQQQQPPQVRNSKSK